MTECLIRHALFLRLESRWWIVGYLDTMSGLPVILTQCRIAGLRAISLTLYSRSRTKRDTRVPL